MKPGRHAGKTMTMHRIDYDRVAQLYDEPERDHVVDSNLLAFLASSAESRSTFRILDIGCGTGKQLAVNRQRFPHILMVGLDRFAGMLRIARRRCPDVLWVQGDGASLPLSSVAFDYITSQFAYPHVRNTGQLLRELCRTLKPGGRFVMTNIDPWSMPEWIIYRYFPEAFALDQQDFVPVDQFVSLMHEAGFQDVRVARDELTRQESVGTFLEFATTRHRASQLMAISDEAYTAGLRRVRAALAEGRDQEVFVRSEFVLVTIVGHKALRETA